MFWGKKERPDKDLGKELGQLNSMARALLEASGVDFDGASALQQALVGTFFFGMVSAHGMAGRMKPIEIHALALQAFQDSLHYTPDAAAQAVGACIEATKPSAHETMNAILHRGIDGHAQFSAGDLEGLASNVRSVLAHFDEG